MLARGHERRLAPAHRSGRTDRHEDLARPLHRLRHLGCDPAHGGLQRREEDPRDQRRPRGADHVAGGLLGRRRSERGGAGNLGGDPQAPVTASALALAIALIVAFVLFGRQAWRLYRVVRDGKPTSRFDDLPSRARAEAVVVVGQSKLLQRLGPGLMHAVIFWGFIVLFPTIVIAMIGAADPHATLPWLGAQGWYALLVDVFAVGVLAGVIAAYAIRLVQRPKRFAGSHLGEANLILAWIGGIVISLLMWHSSQIALGLNDYPREWAPVSNLISGALHGDWVRARARRCVDARAAHPRLPRLPAVFEAPAHPGGRHQRVLHAHAQAREE